MADEHDLTPQGPSSEPQDYADFGGRIAGILSAAETAAAEIRADAERAADEHRRATAADADAYAAERRREADEEADRRLAQAADDAAAVRDAVYAATRRIGEEGTRALEQLRTEARALEGRFETAVDNLRGLISQLEDVVLEAGSRPSATEGAPSETEDEPPVGAWDEPESAEAADADRASMHDDLSPRVARDSQLS
jgi:hypothetical protein